MAVSMEGKEGEVVRGGKLSRRLANPDLRCKNKCGFYGNTIYRGYCSKCFKEVIQQAEQGQSSSGGGGGADPPESNSLFNRFNKKKRVQQTAKGRGRIFKGAPSPLRDGFRTQVSSKKPTSRVVEPFSEFLKTLRKPAAQDIATHLKTFKKSLISQDSSVDDKGEAVQEFYANMAERFQTHVVFRNMSEEQQEDMMDGTEKHLMTGLYHSVFCVSSCDDEMRDLLLVRKIRMLSWLQPTHLEIALDLQNTEVQGLISRGREELWAMDSKKAPQDKLHCISKCSTYLMSSLRQSQDSPPSADEFLPSLIFLLIHSAPQHLHSNINYISRFSNPMRLMSGEAGYYFTNLCGAVSFIETVSAEQLNMSEDDFNHHMGFTEGKTDADLLMTEGNMDQEGKEKLHVLKSCSQGMKELSSHLQLLLVEATELEGKMNEFRDGLREQVTSILVTPLSSTHGVPDLIDLGK